MDATSGKERTQRDRGGNLRVPQLVRIALLAVVYIAAGRLGLRLDAVGGFATLVWAPSGIALAALLLFGPRLWPGISIGAFLVNVWAGAPIPVALGIALGNTLEGILGALALRRIRPIRYTLDRVTDAIALIVFGGGLSTLVGATIGAGTLVLGGVVMSSQLLVTWAAWWLGDAIGDLIVAPLILTWAAAGRIRIRPAQAAEAAAAFILLAVVTSLIFGSPAAGQSRFWHPYMVAPPLAWIALRFGPRGTATATALLASIANAYTALGSGPFAIGPLYENLFYLQTFMAITAATALTLTAAIATVAESARAEVYRTRLLEAERAARTDAEIAEREARYANKAKSDFLAVMSHELRTPLTAIVGYTDLLQSGVSGETTTKQREYLDRIKATSDHLRDLIEGILTFSRLEIGQEADVQMERSDVGEIVKEVADIAEPLVKAKGLGFTIELPPDMKPVDTDPGKLRQVLLNLLSNAVKFTEHGEIRLKGILEDDHVLLRVTDTGLGIAPEHLEKIFEPFWQAERGFTRKAGGTGLGLNVSRRLARAIGGELVVQSALDKGSTFTVILPTNVSQP
jgi:signal transduction histidine kinase